MRGVTLPNWGRLAVKSIVREVKALRTQFGRRMNEGCSTFSKREAPLTRPTSLSLSLSHCLVSSPSLTAALHGDRDLDRDREICLLNGDRDLVSLRGDLDLDSLRGDLDLRSRTGDRDLLSPAGDLSLSLSPLPRGLSSDSLYRGP